MPAEETYNGWANYETWSVALIIDNTKSLYNFFQAYKQELIDSEDEEIDKVYKMMHVLRQLVENMQPQTTNDIWRQLMGAAESRIDYYEIAKNIMEV